MIGFPGLTPFSDTKQNNNTTNTNYLMNNASTGLTTNFIYQASFISGNPIYQIGPIVADGFSSYLFLCNVALQLQSYDVQITIGRTTTALPSALTAAIINTKADDTINTLNLLNPVSGQKIILPQPTASKPNVLNYISALQGRGTQLEQAFCNLSGHAIDKPAAGTYYYSIWMSSSVPSQSISVAPATASPESVQYQLSCSLIAIQVASAVV
jgi:hypothetical protein